MNKLFDDQLIECAKNNYNKGRLSALKDEEEFLKKVFGWSPNAQNRISQIQKEIKEILEMLKKKLKEVEEYRVWDECEGDRKDGKIGILEDLIDGLKKQLTKEEGKE